MKLYSLFKLVNKDFAQYPLYIQQDIKKFCNIIFQNSFINLNKILYNIDQTFLNDKILSNYFKKIIKGNEKLSHSLLSFNNSKYNLKKKFFHPGKNIEVLINKKLEIETKRIKKKSINITLRLRNKHSKNLDRTKLFKRL